MKLRIVGDGTRKGTRVENAATGEVLEGVLSATWEMDAYAGNNNAYVVLRVEKVHLDVVGWCYDVRGIPAESKNVEPAEAEMHHAPP